MLYGTAFCIILLAEQTIQIQTASECNVGADCGPGTWVCNAHTGRCECKDVNDEVQLACSRTQMCTSTGCSPVECSDNADCGPGFWSCISGRCKCPNLHGYFVTHIMKGETCKPGCHISSDCDAAIETCIMGTCLCTAIFDMCPSGMNCTASGCACGGVVCADGEVCSEGACNCGTRSRHCRSGELCFGGTCMCAAGLACDEYQICVTGTCVSTTATLAPNTQSPTATAAATTATTRVTTASTTTVCSSNGSGYVEPLNNGGTALRTALQRACNDFDGCVMYRSKINTAKSVINTACNNDSLSPQDKLQAVANTVNAILDDGAVEQNQKSLITQAAILNFGTIEALLICAGEKSSQISTTKTSAGTSGYLVCNSNGNSYAELLNNGCSVLRTSLQEACSDFDGCIMYRSKINTAKSKINTVCNDGNILPQDKLQVVTDVVNAILDDGTVERYQKDLINRAAIKSFGSIEEMLACNKEKPCRIDDNTYPELFSTGAIIIRNALQKACNDFDGCVLYKNKINSAKSKINTACNDGSLSPQDKLQAVAGTVNAILDDGTVAQAQKELITQAAISNIGTIRDLITCAGEKN